ncbi:MAG TPA: hypothetical protein VNO79_15925 [Actinomycetota bacterium]|nr:hypothetical protein [Actinomycetota bacterium]
MDARRTPRQLGSPTRRRWLATFAILGLLALQGRWASAADLPTSDDGARAPNVQGTGTPSGSQATASDSPIAPRHVTFTLEGCRGSVGTSFPAAGPFICPDPEYTTGNLGKGWNELDRVPHRLTTELGEQEAATTTYNVAIVADHLDGGKPGYDRISVPVVNDAKSDDSCAVVAGDQQVATPGVGGTDSSIYRLLTITQDRGTTCVFDWNERLALGSHLFPGSSLHSNVTQADLTTGGIGARDVSIPVKEILPQELSKEMRAAQGVGFVWDIDKTTQPGRLSFGDTCAAGSSLSREVTITVSWTKEQLPTGDVRIHTEITATNPAHRPIDVQITDTIYEGSDQSTVAEETSGENPKTFPVTRVDANGSVTLEHTITVAGGTSFNDVATAVYTDPVEPDVTIPGQTEARASATVETVASDDNATVTITDTEDIEGDGLSFSVDGVSGATGSFSGGYTLGTETTDAVTWTSEPQSGSGSVTFTKTVRLDEARRTEGSLSDTAQVIGDQGRVLDQARASVDVRADATVRLTIEKSIPEGVLTGEERQDFTFDVTGPDGFATTVTLTLSAGDTSGSTTLTGLEPGTYVVEERTTAGWQPVLPVVVDLNPPTCSGTAPFENQPMGAAAAVEKVTVPAGDEEGWRFTLTGPGVPEGGETVVTGPDGSAAFETTLQEGTYTISEAPQPDYEQTGIELDGEAVEVCTFTVDLPADAGHVFTCVFTNTLLRPDVTVSKQGSGTASAGEPVSFTITVTNLGPGTAHGVTLADPLPAGFQWEITGGTGAEGCSIAEGTLACDFGDMGPAQTHTVVISSPTDADDCGQHRNTATVSAENEGPDAEAPNEASDSVTVLCAGIDVEKTPDGTTVQAGSPITFTITVTNLGPGTAHGVTLTDPLPAGFQWEITGGTGAEDCSIAEGTLACDFGSMAAPSEEGPSAVTVEITAPTTTEDCGVVNNEATVTTTNDGSDSDAGQVTVQCPTPPPPPPPPSPIGIQIVKAGPALAHDGDTITYTFAVSLTTSTPLTNVQVSDPKCDSAPALVSRSGGDQDAILEPGETWTYSCTHVIDESVDGDPVHNVATATGQDDQGRTASDTDDHDVDLIHPAIQVVKTASPTQASPGDTVTYRFEVTNTGDTTLYDVSVDDDVIGHVGDIAVLEPGQTVVLEVEYTVPRTAAAPIVNVVVAGGEDVLGEHVEDEDQARVSVVLPEVITNTPPGGTAFTGTEATRWALLALALLVVGSGLLWVSWRSLGEPEA